MRFIFAVLVLMLGACKVVPERVNEGELIVSEGVKQLFAESGVDAAEAGERVRCERQRRVGTHLIVRVCMTWEEWEAQVRNAQFQLRREQDRHKASQDSGGD